AEYHASYAKRALLIATASPAKSPSFTPSGPSSLDAAAGGGADRPITTVRRTSAATAPTLATVNAFCTSAPLRTPRTFTIGSTRLTPIATACAVVSEPTKRDDSPRPGTNSPRYFANATVTAPITPVLIAAR